MRLEKVREAVEESWMDFRVWERENEENKDGDSQGVLC